MQMVIPFHLGHYQAHEVAGILHRDVSEANILIDDTYVNDEGKIEPRGLLNDWEMSKKLEELKKSPSQGARSVSTTLLLGRCDLICTPANVLFAGHLGLHVRSPPQLPG